MKYWDPDELSKHFESTALSAEMYVGQCRANARKDDRYKALHDEHLAKFYVYNHLHGRTFLETEARFISYMQTFLTDATHVAPDAYDRQRFLSWRKIYINEAIKRAVEG